MPHQVSDVVWGVEGDSLVSTAIPRFLYAPELAKRNGLPLIPFLLEGVAAEPELNLADGIHPNPAGYRIVVENVLETVLPLLAEEAS